MTFGKNPFELNIAKVIKMSLNRRKQQGAQGEQLPAIPNIQEYAAISKTAENQT
jgi:hypothetical protein